LMKHLTELYKSRNKDKTDADLAAYVSGIKSTPFAVSDPITTLPATPAPGSGDGAAAATTTGGTTPAVAAPAAPKPMTPTTAPATTTKPATTTSKKPPVSPRH
jgi:hypothetical protein